jgi:hypothetical protein
MNKHYTMNMKELKTIHMNDEKLHLKFEIIKEFFQQLNS